MAPIKFEEHLKEKLENRSIKPSDDAWKKLSDRLDTQEKSNTSKPYLWLGIAASIVGILFVVSQFWNNESKIEIEPKIADTPKTIQQQPKEQIAVEEVLEVNDFVAKDKPKTEAIVATQKEIEQEKTRTNVSEAIAEITPKDKKEIDITAKPLQILKKNLSFEEQKIQDVIAQVQSMESQNKVVTDDDIDALLQQAQKEIKLNKLINETTGVVDADALLQDVEADLDQSFRSKVFEALKSSYNSVKTAVAQRNN